MLFYDKDKLDEKWETAKSLFHNGDLDGVEAMKVSTNFNNPRASSKSAGVIILYCNNSSDEEKIMAVGKVIRETLDYNIPMYYKTDEQTKVGTKATGQTKNHLYKL